MKIEAVIGANYGDEGKGLFTEYLCRNRPEPLVVLSNGGCQRGHTVNNNMLGVRYVFHHFGSGTLFGAPSVYSKTFLLNPIAYVSEKRELAQFGVSPITFRVPGCILQLPGDMFTNQTLETARAKDGKRHGSCGWGIWETIVRNRQFEKLTFESFSAMSYAEKRSKIMETLDWQTEFRLAEHKDAVNEKILKCVTDGQFIAHFIEDFETMARDSRILDTDNLLAVDWEKYGIDVGTIIVENGQGLLLDKKYAPEDENGRRDIHSTPSKTGLEGVIDALGSNSAPDIGVTYVSRTYLTRHGAGPFPEETQGMKFNDRTNIRNDYQESIRFGEMTDDAVNNLLERIYADADGLIAKDRIGLAFTHCNEVRPPDIEFPGKVYYSYEDDSRKITEK